MAAFQWKDEFCIGNKDIDEQHKQWFIIINEAHNKLLGHIQSDISRIGADALKKAIDYTKFHFSFEEEYMLSIGFSGADNHKKLHRYFIRQLDTIVFDINNGDLVLNSEIIKFLESWLIDHILNEDQKFKEIKK